jgi:hypothetical protein
MRHHQSRKHISTIIQLRTSHGYTHSYLSRIPSTAIESPACTCGYHCQRPKYLLLECKLYNTECKQLKKDIRPLPLTWQTAIYTTRGLEAMMTLLQNTGAGTRAWLMGPRNILTIHAGWMEYDRRDDERRRRPWEEYVERDWGDGVVEDGEAGEEAEGAEGGGDLVGVG